MNGPSTVDSLPRRRRTRTPSAVGRSPAVLTSWPLRVISSISLPMSLMSCSLGTWPVFSWTRIIDRNRMAVVSWVVEATTWSNEDRLNRPMEGRGNGAWRPDRPDWGRRCGKSLVTYRNGRHRYRGKGESADAATLRYFRYCRSNQSVGRPRPDRQD